jgi:hypothetical protein
VHWAQLRTSYWFHCQASTNHAQPVPFFTELFDDIALERDWAPSFPEKYLKDPNPCDSIIVPSQQSSISGNAPAVSNINDVTGVSSRGGGTNPQGSGSHTNYVLTNPANVKPPFKGFKQMNLKAQDIKVQAKEEPLKTPPRMAGCAPHTISRGHATLTMAMLKIASRTVNHRLIKHFFNLDHHRENASNPEAKYFILPILHTRATGGRSNI